MLAAGFAVVVILASPNYRQGESSPAGKRAPEFQFELNGKLAKLADLKGRVVVLNFWATWCPPCVEETPSLNRLHERIASRGGLVFGVSADSDRAAYERFLKNQNIVFPTYRDPNLKVNLSQIALTYGTAMYPETYIIGRDGKIARKVVGAQQWDSPDLIAYLDTLLGQS
jgi:cytochrome c biogenesis protein CcmG, thiol:disulfide interchange protein DsbE